MDDDDRDIEGHVDHTPLGKVEMKIATTQVQEGQAPQQGKRVISIAAGLGTPVGASVGDGGPTNPTHVSDGRMSEDYGNSAKMRILKWQQPPQKDPEDASWFYYDVDNKQHGPFVGATVKQWYDQGWFTGTGDGAKVRRTSWARAEFITIAYDDLLVDSHDPRFNHFCTPPHQRGLIYASYGVTARHWTSMTSLGKKELGQAQGSIWMWYYLDDERVEHGPWSGEVMSEWYQMGYFTKGTGTKIRLGQWNNFYEVFRVFADRQAFVGPPFVSLVCRIEANEQMAAIIRGTSASEVSVSSTADGSSGGVADEGIQYPLAESPRIARVSNSVIC